MSKKKIVACYILHYGLEWLFHSMRSVEPFVDEIRVYYTKEPSHGHRSNLVCPESRDDLIAIARKFGVIWHDGRYPHEGHHRDFAYADCKKAGADIILVVDADEVWLPEQLRDMLWFVGHNFDTGVGGWLVNMIHFWRSLNWVCKDGMWPKRVIVVGGGPKPGYIPQDVAQPLHMGYAQTPELIQYKMSIHGHKSEIRPGWFEEKFLGWIPGVGDVHPTCVDTWTPELYYKAAIEDVVGDHPYFHSELIQ